MNAQDLRDLQLAAYVFLVGPATPDGVDQTPVRTEGSAVRAVAGQLSRATAADMRRIERAVAAFRDHPTWRTRQDVIDSVTVAVANQTRKESHE